MFSHPAKLSLAAILLAAAPLPVLAGSGTQNTQPATNEIAVWAYPARENFCPTGLQPVSIGGVICCGVPNRTGYASHPAKSRSASISYDKGYVAYSKSYSGN